MLTHHVMISTVRDLWFLTVDVVWEVSLYGSPRLPAKSYA